MTPIARLLRQSGGGAAVEFALAVPVLMAALLGVVEIGRMLWEQNALHYAVEEAARCMTIDTTVCSSTSATQSFAASASGVTFATSVFTPLTVACGNQVTASYPFQFLTSLVNFSVTLTASSCFPT